MKRSDMLVFNVQKFPCKNRCPLMPSSFGYLIFWIKLLVLNRQDFLRDPAGLRLPKGSPCGSGDAWHHPVLCFRCSCHWPIRSSGGPHGVAGGRIISTILAVAPSWRHHDITMTKGFLFRSHDDDPRHPSSPLVLHPKAFTSGLREALLDASKLISGAPSFRASVIRDGKRLGLC